MTTSHTASSQGAASSKNASFNGNSHVGMALLSRAFAYAHDAEADVWDFALEIDTLFEKGLTISDLRSLVAKKFAEHGQEQSVYGCPHRSFRRGDGFFFDHTTCVVLTPTGAAFVDQVLREPVTSSRVVSRFETASPAGYETATRTAGFPSGNDQSISIDARIKPFWNSTRHELSLRGTIIKRYRVPAQNQEMILSAFEEEGWPDHIDDPLPVRHDVDSHTRLHDTVNRLNRCQTNRLLRFRGNGSGTGVIWELCQTRSSASLNVKPRAVEGDWPRPNLGSKTR